MVAVAIGAGLGLRGAQPTEAQGPPEFSLPPQAVEVAPGVFFLGTAVDNGRVVEGIALAHHRDGHNKGGGDDPTPTPEPTPPPDPDPAGTDASCYSFIWSDGATWAAAEPYLLNPANGSGLSASAVTVNFATALGNWDSEVAAAIFGGQDTAGTIDGADGRSPDGKNEAYFARIVGPGARGTIAFTIVWRILGGPIIEWDQVYNERFDWSVGDPAASDAMDFLNIAAHEVGHAAGMGHTDTVASCEYETMYPTASNGEIMKRTLEAGDKAGIAALY